jgi:hypothetical protein
VNRFQFVADHQARHGVKRLCQIDQNHADTYELISEWDLTGATATEFGFRLHQRPDGSSDRTIAYHRGL